MKKIQKSLRDSATRARKRWRGRLKVEEEKSGTDTNLVTISVAGWRQPRSHILHYAATNWEPVMLPSKVKKTHWRVIDNKYTVFYEVQIDRKPI